MTWKEEIRKLWKEVGEATSSDGAVPGRSQYRGRKGFGLRMQGRKGETIRRPGNTPTGVLMADERCIPVMLSFLGSTGCGKLREGMLLSKRTP